MSLYKYQKSLFSGPESDIQSSVQAIQLGNRLIRDLILAKKLRIPSRRHKITYLTKSMFGYDEVKENVRIDTLKESLNLKELLEQRLEEIQNSIHRLSVTDTPTKSLSPSHLKDYVKSWKLKEKRKIKELEQLQAKIKAEEKEENDRKLEEEKQKAEKRKEIIHKIQERAIERKEKLKNLQKKGITMKKKPLYIRISEKYQKEVVLPEIEHRNSLLLKKHEESSQVDMTKIQDFARSHNETLLEKEKERKNKAPILGSFSSTLKNKHFSEEINNTFLEDLNKKKERRELELRKIRYAKLVNQFYVPSINKPTSITPRKERKICHPDKLSLSFKPLSEKVYFEKPELEDLSFMSTLDTKQSNIIDYSRMLKHEEQINSKLLSKIKNKVSKLS